MSVAAPFYLKIMNAILYLEPVELASHNLKIRRKKIAKERKFAIIDILDLFVFIRIV